MAAAVRALPVGLLPAREAVAAADAVDARELSTFMRYWTRRHSYLRAVHAGEQRVNLDGSVAGAPSLEQRNRAGQLLWGAGCVGIKKVDLKKEEMAVP